MRAILLSVLVFTGCSPPTESPPHPDLSLKDDEFDAKYFPELVETVNHHTKLQREARDQAENYRSKPGDSYSYWRRIGESESTIAWTAREELEKARKSMRGRLGGPK